MRINYTTYNVCRAQDVVNANTSHHNIMVLESPRDDTPAPHPFRYGRVLGVYHVNAIYVGPGMTDYQPHRLEFVWVRWYRRQEANGTGSVNQKLDRVQFPPVADDDSFGFIDPADILRSCHIIPAFSGGKAHIDGIGLSRCAQDSFDWASYYVSR